MKINISLKTVLLSLSLLMAIVLACHPFAYAADKITQPNTSAPIPEYIIGIGDMLEIVTWREPDFSREEILVRLDGKISFPLLDDIQAAGRTPAELKADIGGKLKDFVSNPSVTVAVRNATSKRFYILGEVVNTGEYELVKNLTVLQAFALAGGFTEWASKKEILLLRREGGKDKVVRINYKKILKGEDFRQNVTIQADDTIIVP